MRTNNAFLVPWSSVGLGALLVLAIPASAGNGGMQWKYVRPSNTGILGDVVLSIRVDDDDRPWVSAYTEFWEAGGMSRMNPDGTWQVVSSDDLRPPDGIVSPRFYEIVKGANGVLWVASEYGLLRYDPAIGSDSLTRYDMDNSPMTSNRLTDIDIAPDGTVWFGQEGLFRFDPVADTWQIWTLANGLPWAEEYPTYPNVSRVAIVPESGGYVVWFGSNAIGVATYENGQFSWYGIPSSVPSGSGPITPTGFVGRDPVDNVGNIWLGTNYGMARRSPNGSFTVTDYPAGLGDNDISAVYAFRNGRAALGTYTSRIHIWDGQWASLGNWAGSHTYALAEDSTGAIWAGGIGGTAKYQDGFWQRYRLTNTGMVGFSIRAISFDSQGNVYMDSWAGTGVGGFDILHPDGTWTNANVLTYGLGLPWPFPTDSTATLHARRNGNLALAPAESGLYEWDGTNYLEHLPGGPITQITEDAAGRIWASSSSGHLYRESGSTFDHYDNNNSPLPVGDINDLFPDPVVPGFVWVATAFGLAHTNGDTWTIYPRELLGLDQYTMKELLICADRAAGGTLWIGTGSGLFHFDPSTLQYTRYDMANSPLPSNWIHRVNVAPDGSIWISGWDIDWPWAVGLTHLEVASGEWTTYTPSNSPLLHWQINALESRPSAAGYELWIGTASDGVCVITVTTSNPDPGDTNCDGTINPFDIQAFITALSDRAGYGSQYPNCDIRSADVNGDGTVNPFDIQAFIDLLAP